MALVKKSKIAADAGKPKAMAPVAHAAPVRQTARKTAALPANQSIAERVAAATQELASGLLIVEDEPIVRLLVVEVLNDLGYRPLEASDGATALRVLDSAQRIDLLITDIGLPDINGRQVADAARVKRPNLKILFMTGYAESAASGEFLEKGMEIIGKPFTMEKLAVKIREMIERRFDATLGDVLARG